MTNVTSDASASRRDPDTVDPTTLAVLRGALRQVAAEMDLVFRLTAFSPIISEGFDSASGIYDADTRGGVVAQGEAGLPVFVGNMQFSVQHALQHVENLQDGDVLIVNDPYYGGTHLMDMKLLAPFYYQGELALVLANTGHWADVGGSVAGGFSSRATEIYQEGVRVPVVKLMSAGELNTALLEVLFANMRIPHERRGDLEAQLNALQRGYQRLEQVFDQFSPAIVRGGITQLRERAESAMRARIASLPDGRFVYEDLLDNDGITAEPLHVCLALEVRGDELTFDFTGSAPACRGPMNNPESNTKSACYIALKHLFPDIPVNEGSFAPINFRIPTDSFLAARFPSAVSGSAAEVTQRVIDVCFGAFAEVLPDRAYALPFSTSANLTIGGIDPRGDKPYVLYLYLGGGLGGHAEGDGLSNATASHSIARIPPMEVYERAYPFRIRRYGLRHGSAGAGRHRGGHGTVLELELLRGEGRASLVADRATRGPSGILGGGSGAPAVYEFIRADGTVERPELLSKAQDVLLHAGDRIRIQTPGGGGYGPAASGQ